MWPSPVVVKPLQKVKEVTEAIRAGQLDTRVKLQSKDEIGELVTAINDMLTEVQRSRTASEKAEVTDDGG